MKSLVVRDSMGNFVFEIGANGEISTALGYGVSITFGDVQNDDAQSGQDSNPLIWIQVLMMLYFIGSSNAGFDSSAFLSALETVMRESESKKD